MSGVADRDRQTGGPRMTHLLPRRPPLYRVTCRMKRYDGDGLGDGRAVAVARNGRQADPRGGAGMLAMNHVTYYQIDLQQLIGMAFKWDATFLHSSARP